MAGRGFPPKPPERRAGHGSKAQGALRVIHADPTQQPELPDFRIESDGDLTDFVWPARTREWWQMWAESPLSADFTANDWSELLDTAVIHARFWQGEVKLAAELRLRVSAFGATPADRARLRIVFAQAAEAEERVKPSSRERRGPLTA
jgi:hypothetical protein